MNLGQGIRTFRKGRGWRQNVFAKKAGISQTYLSQIESGKRIPDTQVLVKIASEFNLPLAVFMWKTLELSDIESRKIEAFKLLKPIIDSLIDSVFPINPSNK